MATILCIDEGNSFTKTGIFTDDKLVFSSSHERSEDTNSTVNELINQYSPQGAIVCSVRNSDTGLMMDLRERVAHVHVLNERMHLPVMNAYGSPESLGSDRIAMAVGSHASYPDSNVLSIGVGTCITYNFVQKNKAFRGGAISPGLNMRLRAMHEFTDKLPLVQADGDLLLLGYDTETSIRSGAINGMLCEIDGMVAAFSAQYPDFNAVLTGGDAPMFANKLKSKIFADPDLLMKGLNQILKYNVPQLQ